MLRTSVAVYMIHRMQRRDHLTLRACEEAEGLRLYRAKPAVVQLQGGKAVRPAEPAGEVKTKKYTG